MGLKLNQRPVAVITFRRDLPEWMGTGKGGCFVEFDARPAGMANPAYLAATESLMVKGRILDAKAKRLEGDDEAFVTTRHGNVLAVVRERLGILYDTCVIEWRSNLYDGDTPIACTRENFLLLAEQKIPEIAKMIADLEQELLEAGQVVLAEDAKTEKN